MMFQTIYQKSRDCAIACPASAVDIRREPHMEKLYDQDSFLTTFSATVESCTQGKKGWEILLDQTAFYPEGSGQPFDTGTLGGVQVLEVHERDGRVVHTCSAPLPVGSKVEGEIDWERRFDLMQHHSGEHIVSGMAHSMWGCDNVGFHMGADVITIDLNVLIDEEQLKELEQAVNRYIWEDHPIVISLPSQSELETLEYRSKKALTGQVRIVSFPGADTCACCGTHVRSSGQVGLVKLLSVQKFREGVRIELVCGNRAMKYLSANLEQNRQVSNLLSAKLLETPSAVKRLMDENAALKSRMAAMEDARFAALAQEYADKGSVLLFQEGLTPDGLRRLCDSVLQTCQGRCACFSGDDSSGYKYAVGEKDGDLRALVKEMNQALNGRGGGKPNFAQGSASASRAEIEAFFAQH